MVVIRGEMMIRMMLVVVVAVDDCGDDDVLTIVVDFSYVLMIANVSCCLRRELLIGLTRL